MIGLNFFLSPPVLLPLADDGGDYKGCQVTGFDPTQPLEILVHRAKMRSTERCISPIMRPDTTERFHSHHLCALESTSRAVKQGSPLTCVDDDDRLVVHGVASYDLKMPSNEHRAFTKVSKYSRWILAQVREWDIEDQQNSFYRRNIPGQGAGGGIDDSDDDESSDSESSDSQPSASRPPGSPPSASRPPGSPPSASRPPSSPPSASRPPSSPPSVSRPPSSPPSASRPSDSQPPAPPGSPIQRPGLSFPPSGNEDDDYESDGSSSCTIDYDESDDEISGFQPPNSRPPSSQPSGSQPPASSSPGSPVQRPGSRSPGSESPSPRSPSSQPP